VAIFFGYANVPIFSSLTGEQVRQRISGNVDMTSKPTMWSPSDRKYLGRTASGGILLTRPITLWPRPFTFTKITVITRQVGSVIELKLFVPAFLLIPLALVALVMFPAGLARCQASAVLAGGYVLMCIFSVLERRGVIRDLQEMLRTELPPLSPAPSITPA
jgi:hypothetical protein